MADQSSSAFTPGQLEAELERSRETSARLLESLAAKLRARPMIRQAAGQFSRAARYVQTNSVKDWAGRIHHVVCGRPAVSILAAAAAGFLIARALRRR